MTREKQNYVILFSRSLHSWEATYVPKSTLFLVVMQCRSSPTIRPRLLTADFFPGLLVDAEEYDTFLASVDTNFYRTRRRHTCATAMGISDAGHNTLVGFYDHLYVIRCLKTETNAISFNGTIFCPQNGCSRFRQNHTASHLVTKNLGYSSGLTFQHSPHDNGTRNSEGRRGRTFRA
jgi:hypothetical protein